MKLTLSILPGDSIRDVFLFPNVGGHVHNLWVWVMWTHHPKKVTFAELPGTLISIQPFLFIAVFFISHTSSISGFNQKKEHSVFLNFFWFEHYFSGFAKFILALRDKNIARKKKHVLDDCAFHYFEAPKPVIYRKLAPQQTWTSQKKLLFLVELVILGSTNLQSQPKQNTPSFWSLQPTKISRKTLPTRWGPELILINGVSY